jgi:hypothetical protein
VRVEIAAGTASATTFGPDANGRSTLRSPFRKRRRAALVRQLQAAAQASRARRDCLVGERLPSKGLHSAPSASVAGWGCLPAEHGEPAELARTAGRGVVSGNPTWWSRWSCAGGNLEGQEQVGEAER